MPLAACVQAHRGKPAWPMEVQVRIQLRRIELLQLFGVPGRNVAVADQLAYDGPVLSFHQSVVLTSARSALGELHQQRLQHVVDGVVDVLRPVVEMSATYGERKLVKHRFQYGFQALRVDARCAAHRLELCHRIHRIDVVHALLALPVALMNRIHAQESRTAIRLRSPPLPAVDHARPGRLEDRRLPSVLHAPAQVVNVRYRDPRQAHILRFAVLLVFALQYVQRGWPAQPLVRTVYLCQQRYIPVCVLARKASPPTRLQFHSAGLPVAADQPCHLRQTQTRDPACVPPDRAALLLALDCKLLVYQQKFHPFVDSGTVRAGEFDPFAALQKLVDLLPVQGLGVLHAYLHPAAFARLLFQYPFQDHLVLESIPVSGSSCIGQF